MSETSAGLKKVLARKEKEEKLIFFLINNVF